MRRARLGRYALWQARDYVMDRGIPTAIVATLLGYITSVETLRMIRSQVAVMPQRIIDKYGSIEAARVPMLKEANVAFLNSFLGPIVFLGALLALHGVVANDRNKGYYRFYFAKPISPQRYYAQAFAVHWTLFVALIALLSFVYGFVVWPIISVQLLTTVAGMFLLYGGVMFLLSAAFRGDWLVWMVFTVLSTALWGWFGNSASIFAKLLYLLPPLNRTAELYAGVATGGPVDWALLQWYAGYGLVCLTAGLYVLRHRRMAMD